MLAPAVLSLCVSALCTAYAWRRTAWFAPATLWSAFCFANVGVLLWVSLTGVNLPQVAISPMPSVHLGPHLATTAAFFAAQALIGPLASLGLGRDGAEGRSARLALAETLRGLPATSGARVYGLLAAGLAAAHLAMIDRDAFVLSTGYLALTDTARNGLDGGLGPLVNHALRPAALPAFLLLAVRPRGRPDLQGALLAAVCLYALAFCMAVYSRYLMVYAFVWLLGRLLARPRFGLGAALAVATGAAAVVGGFLLATTGRGHSVQGLASVLEVAASLDIGAAELLALNLMVTSFDGGLGFANALRLSPDYDAHYAALSFSPLPSALDGFADAAPRMAKRINPYVPISAFSEAWHFGAAATAAYFALTALATRQMTIGFFRHRDLTTIALYPVFLLCLLQIQTYSMRTSLRLLVLAALVSLAACWWRRAAERSPAADLAAAERTA